MNKIAIIGGKGMESPDYLEKVKELKVDNPFGQPDPVVYQGVLKGKEIIHLSRYGRQQTILQQQLNHEANLYALKQLQCEYIFATATCRSLQDEICPGEMIILDQFIDMTVKNFSGIYKETETATAPYKPLRDPFSEELRDHLIEAAIVQGITVHTKGTVLSIDGPRFTSRAESNLYRKWGADVINRVTSPEVILANELGISYVTLALCTGYDSWRNNDTSNGEGDPWALMAENIEKIISMIHYAMNKIEQSV